MLDTYYQRKPSVIWFTERLWLDAIVVDFFFVLVPTFSVAVQIPVLSVSRVVVGVMMNLVCGSLRPERVARGTLRVPSGDARLACVPLPGG